MRTSVRFIVLSLLVLPFFAYAQNEDLRATIGGALLEDPAAAALPQAEFEALLDAMVADAEARGLTTEDIAFVPTPPEQPFSPQAIQEAGSGLTPFHKSLLAIGALLLVALVLWLLYRWLHEPAGERIPPAPTMSSQPPRPQVPPTPGIGPRY